MRNLYAFKLVQDKEKALTAKAIGSGLYDTKLGSLQLFLEANKSMSHVPRRVCII